jgi:hypothetical protein
MALILTAVAPDTEERVRRILKGHELRIVRHIPDATRALEEEAIELIFVGARFDESRMFDLLGYIQADAKHRRIPVVAAIIAPTRMTEETVTGLAHATKVFGASMFINLNDFDDEETQNARLRIVVDALIAPAEAIPAALQHLSRPPRNG